MEQREEELQQQVRSLRLKEASLTRTNAELSHCSQQLETRLNVLEAEHGKLKEEVCKCAPEFLGWYCCSGVLNIWPVSKNLPVVAVLESKEHKDPWPFRSTCLPLVKKPNHVLLVVRMFTCNLI